MQMHLKLRGPHSARGLLMESFWSYIVINRSILHCSLYHEHISGSRHTARAPRETMHVTTLDPLLARPLLLSSVYKYRVSLHSGTHTGLLSSLSKLVLLASHGLVRKSSSPLRDLFRNSSSPLRAS